MFEESDLATARYEMKFNAREAACQTVLNRLRVDSARFTSAYPPRVVNSLYFDTYDLDAFEENLSGASERCKLRLRWYGASLDVNSAVFEVKARRNRLGWKAQQAVSFSRPVTAMGFTEMLRELSQQLDASLALLLSRSPLAVQLNRYHRHYFESADQRIRVTVDTQLAFYDQRFSNRLSDNRKSNAPNILVLEYKAAVDHHPDLAKAVARVPWPRSRNSKYVIGLCSALGF